MGITRWRDDLDGTWHESGDLDGWDVEHDVPQDDPELNAWGTPRFMINADEYCPECEREVPFHYTNCPEWRAR